MSEKKAKNVIVVDDEESVMELIGGYLKTIGFRLFTFTDPKEALAFIIDTEEEIHLLVTDYNMPKTNGTILMQEMRVMSPGLKTVCISGRQRDEIDGVEEFDGFLEKPFLLSKLRSLIENLLQ
ncbi:MAG: response regulator [Parcubacteria group bacterium]|jgi:DNA-binding NtrC family response regulator